MEGRVCSRFSKESRAHKDKKPGSSELDVAVIASFIRYLSIMLLEQFLPAKTRRHNAQYSIL